MEMKEFIENFANQFEDTDVALLKPETDFKNIDEWSSMLALYVIAMADETYNIKLKGDDIQNSNTIEDLYNLMKTKK